MDTVMNGLSFLAIVCAGMLIMGIIALIAFRNIWIAYLLSQLAHHNIFVTTVKEGEGKWIQKLDRAWRFITSSPKTDPKPKRLKDGTFAWNVKESLENQPDEWTLVNVEGEEPAWVQWIERHLLPKDSGMRWVGIPFLYSIHEYNFRWRQQRESKPRENEDFLLGCEMLENGKFVASFSAENIDYLFLRDTVYYVEISGAETKGSNDPKDTSVGIAVKAHINITLRIVDPYRAIFMVHDWLSTIFDLLRPALRSWIAGKLYQEVVGKPETAEHEFDIFLNSLPVPQDLIKKDKGKPQLLGEYLEETYGVRIKRVAFDDVIPPKPYSDAVTRRAEAEQEAVRIETLATAEAKRQTTVADGEAERIRKVTAAIKDGGDIALQLRAFEALEKVGEQGNLVFIGGSTPLEALVDLAKKKGGK